MEAGSVTDLTGLYDMALDRFDEVQADYHPRFEFQTSLLKLENVKLQLPH